MNIKSLPHLWLVCNGEIYNHRELAKKYKVKTATDSDCEIILHLYDKVGMNKLCEILDGVFAFCIYDAKKEVLYSARDRYGVRPSYYGLSEKGDVIIGSEIKALSDLSETIQHFPPGTWWSSETPQTFYEYFDLSYVPKRAELSEEDAILEIRSLLTRAVEKRMMSV